jgi:hypothetical protein
MAMRGWSLYHYDGRWFEHEFAEVDVSDRKLTFDLDVEEGDTVTVTAVSTDGGRYRGDYRYREGSDSNGEVAFDRYRGPAGEVFIGEWHEAGGPRGRWIIRIASAE